MKEKKCANCKFYSPAKPIFGGLGYTNPYCKLGDAWDETVTWCSCWKKAKMRCFWAKVMQRTL